MTTELPGTADAASFDVGQFWYSFDDDHWEWSDEVARMHGYTSAADVTPTTTLMLAHKHPDDKVRVEELIARIRTTREPFSSSHRLITCSGATLPVLVVADVETDDAGEPIGTTGYYIALSDHEALAEAADVVHDELRRTVHEQVEEALARRLAIEQAKGVLKLIYRLDDQQAFELLKWRSQATNVKLRDLAEAICETLPTIELPSAARTQFDHVLLTAHLLATQNSAPCPEG
ncbi:ANTAR domain-containing protein [Gordonia sp. TBRC 11910]|uniref:histidine kinase n=1 Tax=Gordonia asplenii TaxID=2725283 RepID=A0A848L5V3_9ACTN|nr:PAS and ANTAR domain-containing protein [Gordonia asplenii]NMO02988.1 ANTAR domain-containing protein [Gordonia asplenii]